MDQHTSADIPQATLPVSTADRIKSIDTIRGVALLGILLMNIPGFGMNWDYYYNSFWGPRSGWDYQTFRAVEVFFSGTMRGLFSMLFGAGMILFMTNKKEVPGKPSVAIYYYRRLLWLVFFGLINAYVILWEGDILFYYGLFGMVLFVFRKTAPKWLLVIGLTIVSFSMIQSLWRWSENREIRANYLAAMEAKKEKKKLTEEQQSAIGAWTAIATIPKPDTAEVNENYRGMQSNYIGVFQHLIPINSGNESFGVYYSAWDVLSMMFIGMALFSWGFFTNKLSTSTYFIWLIVGYGIGIPLAMFIFDQNWIAMHNRAWFTDRWQSNPGAFRELRRVLISVGHASLIMLLFRSKLLPWLMKALGAVGQMAFTNYLMQSIICTFFFFGYGWGYFGKLHFHQIYYVVGAVWVFQLIFSVIWLRYFRFGPFEWAWRSLTYWKKQPMRL